MDRAIERKKEKKKTYLSAIQIATSKDIKIMICGPPPMVSAMKKATESLGYEKARAVSKLADQVFCF